MKNSSSNTELSYKNSGVDVLKGELFVKKILPMIKSTYDNRVLEGVGGFAALYEIDEERLLALGTDGVGTKLKLAIELGIHHTIGIDLVAMCANDILCTGAMPLVFLDYLATSKIELDVHTKIVEGMVQGCKQAKCALIGGETAEMPGMYEAGDYDLAGFCVGEVKKSRWLKSSLLLDGDQLIGISSSGFHSNGYSLLRKMLALAKEKKYFTEEKLLELKKQLLIPTKIYMSLVNQLLQNHHLAPSLHGLAHITGGGFKNIERMNSQKKFNITTYPDKEFRSSSKLGFMDEFLDVFDLEQAELFQTFNMGIGLVLAVEKNTANIFIQEIEKLGERALILGEVLS